MNYYSHFPKESLEHCTALFKLTANTNVVLFHTLDLLIDACMEASNVFNSEAYKNTMFKIVNIPKEEPFLVTCLFQAFDKEVIDTVHAFSGSKKKPSFQKFEAASLLFLHLVGNGFSGYVDVPVDEKSLTPDKKTKFNWKQLGGNYIEIGK